MNVIGQTYRPAFGVDSLPYILLDPSVGISCELDAPPRIKLFESDKSTLESRLHEVFTRQATTHVLCRKLSHNRGDLFNSLIYGHLSSAAMLFALLCAVW